MRRFGLTTDQLELCPKITPLLKRCGIKPEQVMEVLGGDTDPDSSKLVQVWTQLTQRDRPVLGMEGLALACGMSPRRLWELYNGANLMQSRESIAAMIADALPAIMARTIKDAKTMKGFGSREHIYKAARILPTPKGTIINLPGAGAQKELDEGDEESEDEGFEEADNLLLKASRAMNNKVLPAPPEIEDEEEE